MAGILLNPDGCSHHGEIAPRTSGQLVVKFDYHPGIVAAFMRSVGHRRNPDGDFGIATNIPENQARLAELAARPPPTQQTYITDKPTPAAAEGVGLPLCT